MRVRCENLQLIFFSRCSEQFDHSPLVLLLVKHSVQEQMSHSDAKAYRGGTDKMVD